jgi:hypothetical protein
MGRSRLRPRRTVSSGSRSAVRHGSEGPSGPLRLSSSVSVSPLLVAGSHRSKVKDSDFAQVALCLLEESLGLARREGELSNANVVWQGALAAAVRMNEHEGAVPRQASAKETPRLERFGEAVLASPRGQECGASFGVIRGRGMG